MAPDALPVRPPPVPSDDPVFLHAVRFYRDAGILCRIAGDFLADGLSRGEAGVMVATPAHRTGMLARLTQRGLDVDTLQADGTLLLLDAEEAMATFMIGGMPDRARFTSTMAPVLTRASLDGARHVRLYGEIVNVLWQAGLTQAALRLEMFWNMLARVQTFSFSLLCGYAAGNTYVEGAVDDICGQHSHVLSNSGATALLS